MGSVGRHIYIHGGELEKWLDDSLFMYDTLTNQWFDIPAEEGPEARYCHTLAGVAGSRVFLFGGETMFGKTNQLLELDVTIDPPIWTDLTEVCLHFQCVLYWCGGAVCVGTSSDENQVYICEYACMNSLPVTGQTTALMHSTPPLDTSKCLSLSHMTTQTRRCSVPRTVHRPVAATPWP
jgi:hypothetical protein